MENRQEFIDKLSKLSKEEMLERYVALLDSEKLTDYVADLEAKLAESENKIAKARRQAYSSRQMDNTLKIRRLADEITAKEKAITKLKQQLTEKDATIKYLKDEKDGSEQANELLNKVFIEVKEELAEKEKEETKRMEEFEKGCQEYYKSNQTAIAELEKVKSWADIDYRKHCYINAVELDKYIDQQIKSLKGDADGNS